VGHLCGNAKKREAWLSLQTKLVFFYYLELVVDFQQKPDMNHKKPATLSNIMQIKIALKTAPTLLVSASFIFKAANSHFYCCQ